MLPEQMKLVVIRQTGKQFSVVKDQLFRKEIGEIIIATDAGREGELVAQMDSGKSRVQEAYQATLDFFCNRQSNPRGLCQPEKRT